MHFHQRPQLNSGTSFSAAVYIQDHVRVYNKKKQISAHVVLTLVYLEKLRHHSANILSTDYILIQRLIKLHQQSDYFQPNECHFTTQMSMIKNRAHYYASEHTIMHLNTQQVVYIDVQQMKETQASNHFSTKRISAVRVYNMMTINLVDCIIR